MQPGEAIEDRMISDFTWRRSDDVNLCKVNLLERVPGYVTHTSLETKGGKSTTLNDNLKSSMAGISFECKLLDRPTPVIHL